MVNLACLLVWTFGNFLTFVLIVMHTVINFDLSNENVCYQSD